MIDEIVEHCAAGRVVVIAAPAGMGKTWFLENELRPALQARQLGHLQIEDQFEDRLRMQSVALCNPQILAINESALPRLERLEWHTAVIRLPRKDIVEEVCAAAGFQIDEEPRKRLGEYPASLYQLTRGLRRLMDAERRLKSFVIRQSTLDAFGGPERLILGSLDETIAQLDATQQQLLFRWCNLLLSKEGTRVARTEKELTAYAGKLNRFALAALPRMTGLKLLRQLEMPDATRFEFARECLVPLVQDWWTRRQTDIVAKERARFRVRSVTIAVGSILTLYVTWILMTWKR